MTNSVHSARYDAFREALVAARKAACLTQDEVARRLDRPQSYLSKVESGERRLDVVEFLDVAEAVGFDPAEFVRALAQRSGKRGWRRR